MNKQNLKHQSKTNWDRIDKMRDDEIDYPEIPELDDAFFKNAKVVMPHHKDLVYEREIYICYFFI